MADPDMSRRGQTPAPPPTGAPAVEIVAAGNEVLSGDVQDTNTNRLCTLVTGLGGAVTRAVLVRDDVDAIAREVAEAVARRPALVFTVGGLGPTSDDRTLERMVREKYAEFYARGYVPFAGMNDARRKMAMLPAGAEPVINPIGGAPGVLTWAADTAIVSLPGVPEELVAIVEQSLDDLFAQIFGAAHYEERALIVALQDESAIATILRQAELDHPAVYIKSRAKVLGSTRVIRITLSARGPDAQAVDALLRPAADQLLTQIRAAGYRVEPAPPTDGEA